MSALNFENWWSGEGKESNKWLSEKGVAHKAWNAAIKAKEAGELGASMEETARPTKQSLPCRWCGYPLNAKLQCVNGSCDHCGE